MLACIVPETTHDLASELRAALNATLWLPDCGSTSPCVARCATVGRQSAGAEAELRQGDRLIARAISTHTIVDQRLALRSELERA
jgi:hypothetical protein